MSYEFLSPEWITAAEAIRAELGDVGTPAVAVVMNLIVTDVPFGASPLHAHLDTTVGVLALAEGHHGTPDILVTVDWATAKALLIEGKPQAVMSAFMAGKVRVEGDMSKLVALQGQPVDERSVGVVDRFRAITA